ncbi:MAG: polysaccharide deacetylase family protein [Proteobacteria bacterium]|nr:polysaccharide deacetylase family protein [Pseudomonadota bacterium]
MADQPHKPASVPPVDETREPGMDHAHYPYRPLPEAPRIAWPDGARVAFTVTINLDRWEPAPPSGPGRDPRMASPLGAFAPEWLTFSHREYGPRVGIFRLLDVLDRFGLRPSVALGAAAARAYPELVDELSRRDACFMAHGTLATRRITSRMTEAEERALIAESRAAVQEATGTAPAGWAGQDFNESARTPALLAEAGFAYTTDWPNDDRPFRLGPYTGADGAARTLLALPPQPEWNDAECLWVRRTPPWEWADMIAEACAALHAEGGACFNITLHPWVTGQAHRIRYLSDALSRVLGLPGLWRATTDEVAAYATTAL